MAADPALARSPALSAHRARHAIRLAAQADVRGGWASDYELLRCRRRSRVRIACTVRMYGVTRIEEDEELDLSEPPSEYEDYKVFAVRVRGCGTAVRPAALWDSRC